MNVWKSGMLAGSLVAAAAMPAIAQNQVVEREAVVATSPEDGGYYKASDLIGMEVRGNDNQELGEVQDLFIANGSNEVEYLILDTGVFADLGGQQPIIPWTIVTLQPGTDAHTHIISIPLTQDRIRTAPMINLTDVDLMAAPAWSTQVNEFYATELQERRVSRPELDQNREGRRANRNRNRDGARSETDRPDANTPDANTPDANTPDANRPRRGQRNPGAGTNPNRGNRPGATNPATPADKPDATPSNKPDATTKPDATDKPEAATDKPATDKPATDKPEAAASDKPATP